MFDGRDGRNTYNRKLKVILIWPFWILEQKIVSSSAYSCFYYSFKDGPSTLIETVTLWFLHAINIRVWFIKEGS